MHGVGALGGDVQCKLEPAANNNKNIILVLPCECTKTVSGSQEMVFGNADL